MQRDGTIWLVGMMGAGKSAVGARLAERLGRELVDTDAAIEAEAGASVRELFERDGEASFRRREREMIERVAGKPVVAALGGGAIAQPGAAERLAATGTVVYLRARPETLLARIGDADERPLLAHLDDAGRRRRLRGLLAERAADYESAALTVDTDDLDEDAVADRVLRALGGGAS